MTFPLIRNLWNCRLFDFADSGTFILLVCCKGDSTNPTRIRGWLPTRIRKVGCRGGSRYFEGVCGFLGIQKIQNIYLVKIPRFHADQISWKNGPYFLKTIFVSVGFAYDFAFCQNNGSPKFIPWKSPWNKLGNDDLFGASGGSKNVKILDFQNVQIWKDNMFLRCFHIFSCIFWVFWW